MKITFSVVIPTHNRADALAQTLEILSRQEFEECWEVIVINNNCTDETNEVVRQRTLNFPVELYLVSEKTPGAAAARNAGGNKAKGEFLVFIDNDILVEPNFLARHQQILRENQGCWVVGAIANLPEQENSPFGRFRKSLASTEPEHLQETDFFSGANSSLPLVDFKKIGGFDENFRVASGEDQEMAMRARKELGIKTLFAPNIVGIHNDWAGWTFADFCLRQQIYARTEYLFWKKYGNEHPRLQMIRECLPISLSADTAKMIYRKAIKQIFAGRIFNLLLAKVITILESRPFFRPILWQFYKMALSGAIYRGFREGMKSQLGNKN